MDLTKKVIVVAGGTGAVGEGIVKALLETGATIVVPVRTEGKGNSLREYTGNPSNLDLIAAQPGQYDSAMAFIKEVVARYGRIDLAIASIGGWYQGGRMAQVPMSDWLQVMDNNLNAHFVFAKAMLSYFHEGDAGTYVMINGGASEMVVPGAGPMSVIAAAQKMMAQVFRAETRGTKVEVYSVAAFTPVITRTRPSGPPDWLKAEEIGHYIAALYRGEKGDEVIHQLT